MNAPADPARRNRNPHDARRMLAGVTGLVIDTAGKRLAHVVEIGLGDLVKAHHRIVGEAPLHQHHPQMAVGLPGVGARELPGFARLREPAFEGSKEYGQRACVRFIGGEEVFQNGPAECDGLRAS